MDRWSLFFGLVSVIIVVTMMVPRLFGLHQSTQWGGMYVDGWCSLLVTAAPLESPYQSTTTVATARVTEDDRPVWYTPMHTEESCIGWAHSFCGTPSSKGWPIVAAYAYLQGTYLLDGANICTLPFQPSFQWYRR
ncbi:hypothetical protein HY285_00945 [Candidatus Peregrinibacteria bacterium]|nr:hypothetical protein [Candidatus Peregrinibacteria bacterium]MBI3816093.1 hypothetical protein [Candidatus Peregrinibacteria bacterium]